MSDAAEKYRTAQELQEDLLDIKLRLAFQEELEEEIEELARDQYTDPQIIAMMNDANARIMKRIHRAVRRRRMTRAVRFTLPKLAKALTV